MTSKPLTNLQQENLEAALNESAAMKDEMRKRLARILARMQASGEVKPSVTLEQFLGEDEERL
jgi:predicted RNase H-like nuclease (RuvC/YqgF family)